VLGRPTAFDAQSVSAQVPTFTGDYELNGQDALRYVNDLRRIIPGTNWYFLVLDQVINCALKEGVVAARAYVGKNDQQLPVSATVVVVLSAGQLQNLTQAAVKCALATLHVPNGGPTDGFSPCAEAYSYDVQHAARYFVLAASSTQTYCAAVKNWHAQRNVVNDIWSVGL
jgi:hypothetical protein